MNARAIEQSWARVRRLAGRYRDEWEGQDLAGEDPLRVYAAARSPRRVLVVTKEAPLKRWQPVDRPPGLAVVVLSGNVSPPQAEVLRLLASDASAPIAFVGDADPMGLHTYLSLQAHLGARRVRFCGICDEVLGVLDDERAKADKLGTVQLSAFDKEHLRVVTTLARPEQVLGPGVGAVLARNRKIALEALSFRADLTPALFRAALQVSGLGAGRRRSGVPRRSAR